MKPSVREYTNHNAAAAYYRKQRSALARQYNGKWLVFVPASAAIGHASGQVIVSGTLRA